MIHGTLPLAALIAATTALALLLDRWVPALGKLGASLLALTLGSLSVASQAAVGGPSTALAVAAPGEWPGFVLPGIIVGLVGYAVGNYLGIGVADLVRVFGIGL